MNIVAWENLKSFSCDDDLGDDGGDDDGDTASGAILSFLVKSGKRANGKSELLEKLAEFCNT